MKSPSPVNYVSLSYNTSCPYRKGRVYHNPETAMEFCGFLGGDQWGRRLEGWSNTAARLARGRRVTQQGDIVYLSIVKEYSSFFRSEYRGEGRISLLVYKSLWAYLTPRKRGGSPGALDSVSILSESTWPRQRTVAATHQGSPSTEHRPVIRPTTSMSRWYPHPFCIQATKDDIQRHLCCVMTTH